VDQVVHDKNRDFTGDYSAAISSLDPRKVGNRKNNFDQPFTYFIIYLQLING